MIKYMSFWLVLVVFIAWVLYGAVSLISNAVFVNIFSEFEIILNLVGFSSVLSTIIISTKIIFDKLNK